MKPRLQSMDEQFRAQVARAQDAVALETDEARYTYRELDSWVEAMSRRLADADLEPGQLVAVALPRSPAFVMSLLAVNRSGAAYVPIDPELPAERIGYMFTDAAPTLVLYCDATKWISADTVRSTIHVADAPEPGLALGRVMRPDVAVVADTPVYVCYTSGSTGRPKGVVMGAGTIDNLLAWHRAELGTGPGRRVAQFTATGFDILVQEVFPALTSGATVVIPGEWTRRDPSRLARWLADKKITDLFAPNLIVEAVCEAALGLGLALPDLEYLVQGGEQLTLSDAVRAFARLKPGRRLYNQYGLTETHAMTCYLMPRDPGQWPPQAPVGRPIHNARAYVLDNDLQQAPVGQEGELFIAGIAVAHGYHGRPALTADRFIPDPFAGSGQRMYRTGDIGRIRLDGLLEYLGRADQQVKIRGTRIELGEIDAAIRAQPGVRDVVLMVRGEGAAKRIDAYLVPALGVGGEVAESVRDRLSLTLPAVMIPSSFTLLPALPVSVNGKVDRNALPSPAGGGQEARPESATQRQVLISRLFAECLGLEAVAIDANFFALGGHSLSAAKLAAQVRDVLGVDVTIADIFANPTVRKLAVAVPGRAGARRLVAPAERTSAAPASFAQERLLLLDQFSGPNILYNVPIVIRMRGRLGVTSLRTAINDLVARHEVLRTRLAVTGLGLRQYVLDAGEVDLVLMSGLTPMRAEAALDEAARHVFDLTAEAPFRAHLFSCGEEDHLLLLVIHHIAVDGWSLRLLTRDLGFAYTARQARMAPPWRSLPLQYSDYATWQRERLGRTEEPSDFARGEAAFWGNTLRGLKEPVTLATSRPRPPERSPGGDWVPIALSRDLHTALRNSARRAECTVFMIVHAALAILLHLHGAGDDIVVGATVAGRADGALDDLVGFFVNTLVLRTNLSGDPTLAEIVDRVRQADLEAMAHQEYPFDQVVNVLKPRRSMAYSPVVQVMLAFQVREPDAPQMVGLKTEMALRNLGVAKFDLTFELAECFDGSAAPDGIRGHLEYSTDLFDNESACRLAKDISEIFHLICEAPASHLRRLTTCDG